MQIWRHGEKSNESKLTDDQILSTYLPSDWHTSDGVELDATVDKDGSKHTRIGVVLSDDDIVELSSRLFTQLKKENAKLHENVRFLRESLRNISLMSSPGIAPSPPPDGDLILQINLIARLSLAPEFLERSELPENCKPRWYDWEPIT